MDAIDALTSRVSIPKLVDPAPDEETLKSLFQAAARAADRLRSPGFAADIDLGPLV